MENNNRFTLFFKEPQDFQYFELYQSPLVDDYKFQHFSGEAYLVEDSYSAGDINPDYSYTFEFKEIKSFNYETSN